MAHSSLRYALFWQTPVYQSYGSFLYVALRLYIHEDEKSPGSLTYQDQQTGASNFVNIDFLELFHIFLSTWHSMAYLIQNAENQRFKSPLLPYQSILHLCLPTKKSGSKKPGNGWCAWIFSGTSIPFGKYGNWISCFQNEFALRIAKILHAANPCRNQFRIIGVQLFCQKLIYNQHKHSPIDTICYEYWNSK